jgi:hypothetical protein
VMEVFLISNVILWVKVFFALYCNYGYLGKVYVSLVKN